jgi:hypothetical protein
MPLRANMRALLLPLAFGALSANAATAQPEGFEGDFRFPSEAGPVLHLRAEPFDPAAHEITTCGYDQHCVIDGAPAFGADFTMPQSILVAAQLEVSAGTTVTLDVSGMVNPWLRVAQGADFSVSRFGAHTGGWVVTGRFSSEHVAYRAEWLVIGRHSVRRLLLNEHDYDLCQSLSEPGR